jgi:hypothetical protein
MASSIKGNVWRMFIHVVALATSFPFIPFLLLFSLSPPLKFHSFVSFPSFKWLIFFYLPIIIHWVSISRKTKTRTILHNIKSELNDKSFLYPRQSYNKPIHISLKSKKSNRIQIEKKPEKKIEPNKKKPGQNRAKPVFVLKQPNWTKTGRFEPVSVFFFKFGLVI